MIIPFRKVVGVEKGAEAALSSIPIRGAEGGREGGRGGAPFSFRQLKKYVLPSPACLEKLKEYALIFFNFSRYHTRKKID